MRVSAKTKGAGRGPGELLASRARRSLRGKPELIVLAASTGGPGALRELMLGLPTKLGAPVVVVQHLPPSFVASFARQLDRRLDLSVRLATAGGEVLPDTVWFAPGEEHLSLRRDRAGTLRFRSDNSPPVRGCRPAADVLFRAAAQVCGAKCMAVVLTGMGKDGCAGAREIAAAGGQVIVQDQASSAVWGMPGSVVRAEVGARILPLSGIAQAICGRG